MSESEATPTKVTILCEACGDLIELSVPEELLRALHQVQFCPATEGVLHA